MRRIFNSIGLAFEIFRGGLRLLGRHPKLIVPLIPVFIAVLMLQMMIFDVDILSGLALIFIVAFMLMFSFTISSQLIHQISTRDKLSIEEAISSESTLKMIPRVFFLSLIWFLTVLVLVAIEMIIDWVLSLIKLDKVKVGGVVDSIFGTVATALRMMGFMLIPLMLYEDVGLRDGFRRMKEILKAYAFAALGGLTLTKVATTVLFLLVAFGFDAIYTSMGTLGMIIMFFLLGLGWCLSVYLEQIFVTGLYLYATNPNYEVVGILLEKQIGRTLPAIPQTQLTR